MNAKRFSDLRKWGRDVLDIEVNRTFLAQGLMGSIWGANIFITRKMPENLIMAISEEQHHIAAILEVGQEKVYNLTGLGELMTDIRNQRKQLDGLYDSLEQMILKSLTVIEQEKNGKPTQS